MKNNKGVNWVSVEDKPLADITIEFHNTTSPTVTIENYVCDIDMLFAVPLWRGQYAICRGYITPDGDIYEQTVTGNGEWWGYSLDVVTHYAKIFNPKPKAK